jgi:hypothetical protein
VVAEGAFIYVGNLVDGKLFTVKLFILLYIFAFVTVSGIVRAGYNARLATYAEVLIDHYYAFGGLIGGAGRACVIAGGILAVHAEPREKDPAHVIAYP